MLVVMKVLKMGVQTAMIIDDDVDTSFLLANLLKKRKILSLAVHSLREAEECLSYMKPTIIFLDNSFPEGLGVNFIRNIKSIDEEIKIIMITADSSAWIKGIALDEGINYFLEKPLSKQVIDGVLDNLKFRKD